MRHTGLLAPVFGCLFTLCLVDVAAFAQAPSKEASPFDWLRHDAPAVNRPGGPTLSPPTEMPVEPRKEAAQPVMDEAVPVVAEVADAAPVSPPPVPPEDAVVQTAPSPMSRPAVTAPVQSAAKAKAALPPAMDQIEVVNRRSVMLNELKLVSLKNSRKPFVVRPSLKAGQSLKIDIPKDWGCIFLVWTQFSEEPSEQYDGVDLCVDKTLNLVN